MNVGYELILRLFGRESRCRFRRRVRIELNPQSPDIPRAVDAQTLEELFQDILGVRIRRRRESYAEGNDSEKAAGDSRVLHDVLLGTGLWAFADLSR